jgi:hypothetical protein
MGLLLGSTDRKAGEAAHDRAYRAILEAARAFTLADHGAPVVGNSWTDFVEPDLVAATEFSREWLSDLFEGSPSQLPPVKLDNEALAWAERYLRMDKKLRGSAAVALDRLNLARRRRSFGDQAIDCSICLEALLGDESPQELSYKLQLRAGLLLGSTLTERQEIRQAIKKLYALRSKVVHGSAREPKDALADAKWAAHGLEICTQAVRASVEGNTRPDFATWELMGDPTDDQGT